MRLIDADELKERAYEMILEDPDAFNGGWSVNAVTTEEIDESPTIEAVPVVHGEWTKMYGSCMYVFSFRCSECNRLVEFDTNFCPNCGAKMDGKVV